MNAMIYSDRPYPVLQVPGVIVSTEGVRITQEQGDINVDNVRMVTCEDAHSITHSPILSVRSGGCDDVDGGIGNGPERMLVRVRPGTIVRYFNGCVILVAPRDDAIKTFGY